MPFRIFLLALCAGLTVLAQQGDEEGEIQAPAVPKELIPPAPVVPPEQALKTFKLQPGFRLELVASEPLVHNPIQITFDPDGRLWVLEMRGFMPNIDGQGELEKTGDVVVLEDTDGDGKIDKRTVFLDGLVMPRALALVRGGALVAEPPNLWFCRDTNGDLTCDEKTVVATDYATQADPKLGARANPEHTSNGLLRALDNWIYSANHTTRFRNTDGSWQREPTIFRGQWGISQDDFGRLFYNSNEDPLRADFVPAQYLGRNPHYRNPAGVNEQLYEDKAVWPIRVNPGVNRGYRKGQLRPDGTLATFTAACAPLVYRGDNFPAALEGSVFVCEPAGNLIRRYVLEDHGVSFKAKNACDKAEFLASTDERFRPVNLNNGPDGCLYIVDMYHGILQHRLYVTSYLRQQMLDRGLDQHTDLGRIYRVASETKPPGPRPHLSNAGSEELVQQLSHPNGWWRDTAQRLLVERNDPPAVATLKQLAISGASPLGRLHALWTLEGIRQLDSATLRKAISDAHPKVRSAAIRISEPLLNNQPELLNEILKHIEDTAPDVQLQLVFSLGEVKEPRAEAAMARIARQNGPDVYLRDAIITGLGGRELEFLERILIGNDWENPGSAGLLGALAQCVFSEAKPDRVNRLLDLAAGRPAEAEWRQSALLDGILSTAPPGAKGGAKTKPVRLNAEPPALATLGKSAATQERAKKIAELITWPGKPGAAQEVAVKPLTAEEKNRFDQGKELFLISCGACHQPHGMGQEGLAPPLVDSEWVLGPPQRLVRIVLHGLHGPINVKGRTFQLDMPALGVFDDDQIAATLTYIRREWGHTAGPIESELVKRIRAETEKREEAWSEAELLKVP
jgi:putative membrane-bound dehydrogenase-like protein